jgi:tetratricopeptide (TPR) repeat protein
MIPRPLVFFLTPALIAPASAREAPPEKALRYHEALLKRPQNAALFDRFYGAWIDEQPVETLDAFLLSQAEKNGGQEWSVLARYQLRRGQEDNALGSFAKAMEALPDDASLPLERAKIRLRRMEFAAAREDLAKVAAGKDEALALEAAKLTGKSWMREGKSDEAVKAWDALLAKHPGDEDLLEDLVESAAAEGEIDQALAYLAKLIVAGADPYKKTLRALRRGDLLAQGGKHDEAVAAYAAALDQVGEGSWLEREVLAQVEKVFRMQDRLDDLTEELKKLAAAHPRRLLIHRQLAKLEAAQGETDSAIGRFREVLKRSPGDRELREEFVRLLTDGERFEDAAAELEKMIELAPADAGLQLQMAALQHRQNKGEAVLAALAKAHELLGRDEGGGIRIASLMFQYGQAAQGEALLKGLIDAQGAGPAPAEALAAEFSRTNRKDEALELLKKVGAADELEVVMRAAGSISALGESETAFGILAAKAEKFAAEPKFLSAMAQTALAANKPVEAIPQVMRLVRLSKQSSELGENIALASRVILAADQVLEWRTTLEGQETRTPAETCLLAALAEGQGDFEAVGKLLETATDPLMVRFYAALLDRRGEFELAIAALSRLADTDEGRKAAFFKDLSELQQRAGKTADALATVERWKQSAPGDKTAWVTGSRLLRESGKPEEAVKVTRQAVARFEGDADLSASLASLHEEAGQWAEAEAIYWRLYDESQSPADQVRWAAQLAQLAMRTGRTEDLDEKLQERARGNRRSVGPVLAQVELARVMQNDDKRRDLLLEAVRLQPKDVDLRLQIANLEEQSGNPERVVAILEEALVADTSGRIRSALAQAYLRQGQTLKGMRELQAMSGKNANDPRLLESSAATLAGAGMFEEAIRFLRESLPDGGDWRTRYLLAVMLEQDGREAEAIPIFLSLQQAQGELPGITSNPQGPQSQLQHFPEEMRPIVSLSMAAQLAHAHQNQQQFQRYSGMSMTGPFLLPEDAESVRRLSLIHLAKLSKKSGEMDEGLAAQLRAAGVTNLGFVSDLIESTSRGQPDFAALLEKHPDEPGLLEMAVMYGSYYGQGRKLEPALVRKAMEKAEHMTPLTRFRAGLVLTADADKDDPAWEALVAAARDCINDKDQDMAMQVGYHLLRILSAEAQTIPEARREDLKNVLLDLATTASGEEDKLDLLKLSAFAIAGTREQWIDVLNAQLRKFRANTGKSANAGFSQQMQARFSYAMQMRGYNPWMSRQSPFALPDLEALSFTSLPADWLMMIRPKDGSNQRYYGNTGIDPAELVKLLDRFESPVLRAWIALRAGDDAAAAKALAVTPPAAELADFNLLLACQAIREKKFADAYRLLEKTRAASSGDRNMSSWLNLALIAVASEMTGEERKAIADPLRAVIVQCRQVLGIQGAPILAEKAKELGFEDLANRFQAPVITRSSGVSPLRPAAIGARTSGPSSSSGGNASLERMVKLSSEKKYEAAARDALLLFRKAKANPWNSGYELRELTSNLSEETRAELLRMTEPGDSKSLTKRLEYADLCAQLDQPEKALATLEVLAAERPDDASIAGKMAFLLPPDQRERTLALINRAANSPEFVESVHNRIQQFEDRADNMAVLEFFDVIAAWLESADPAALDKTNLTWVGYHAKGFFEGRFLSEIPSLLSGQPMKIEDKQAAGKYAASAKRLALAMLRHPGVSEEGFRLLSASKAWQLPPEELDAMARAALLAASPDRDVRSSGRSFFTLVRNNGGSSSGGDLDAHSSVRWLTGRLAKAKSADEILPPAYLRELTAKNPKVGELVTALAGISTVEQLGKLWESDSLKSASDPVTLMLRQGVLARAGTIKGAGNFFLTRIAGIPPAKFTERMYRGDQGAEFGLLGAALLAGSSGSQSELDAICAAVSKLVFGEGIDWEKTGDGEELYHKINIMEQLLRPLTLDPAATLRLHRSFFRLGTPVGSNEYPLMQPFRNRRLAKPEDAEEMFESLGWFADAATWEPFAAVLVDADHNGAKIIFTREAKLLNERVISYTNMGFSRSDLVKRLKQRKPQTFGTLITAASITSGKEREELTAAAFSAARPTLAKLTPARMEGFALLLPWLPADDVAKLPAPFREKAKKLDDSRRQELAKRADEFLANKTPGNSYNSPFDQIEDTVAQLAPLDFAKALELFLEAERRFTTSLTRGGQLSSYTSNGLSIAERDEALNSILAASESPLSKDPAQALRFLSAVLKSPEGARFSLASTSYDGQPILYRLGSMGSSADNKDPGWLRAMKAAAEMPEEVRQDALLAVFLYELSQGSSGASNHAAEREKLAELSGVREPLIALRKALIGVTGWNHDSPEQRANTSKALVSLMEDEAIAEPTRMQLAFTLAAKHPAVLADPAISSAVATHFETYCETDRSAVNTLGLGLMKAIGNATTPAESKPFTRRMHDAFWKNSNAAKAGGHSQIPPVSVTSLFLAAARVGDEATAAKLLAQAKTSISGDLPTITSLISAGQFDLAKSLLPDAGRIYRSSGATEPYSLALEQKLAEFAKQDVVPLQFARLECQLLAAKPAEGDRAAKEAAPDRSLRLAAAFRKDPPEDRMIQLEMLVALTNSNYRVTRELRDELTALAKSIDFEATLRDWTNGTGAPADLNPRYLTGALECSIIRQAALVSLLDGDATLLENMVRVMVDAPKYNGRSNNSNSNHHALRHLHRDLINAAHTWTCIAVASGRTSGIEKALEPLETLTAATNERTGFEATQVVSSLALCQFLAHWNGQPERFDALLKRMPKQKSAVKNFSEPWGLRFFVEAAARHPAWRRDDFAATRREFLTIAFSRPSLAGMFPHIGSWVDSMGRCGLRKDLLSFRPPLPDAFIPAVRSPLIMYYGRSLNAGNQPDEAIAAFRQGLLECPPEPEWNHFRGALKYELAAALLRAQQADEAKTVHASIPPAEVAGWLKERHRKLGADLAAAKKK